MSSRSANIINFLNAKKFPLCIAVSSGVILVHILLYYTILYYKVLFCQIKSFNCFDEVIY